VAAAVAVSLSGIAALFWCPKTLARRHLPRCQQVEGGRFELASPPLISAVTRVGTVWLVPECSPVPRPTAGIFARHRLAAVGASAGSAFPGRRQLHGQPDQAGQNNTRRRQSLDESVHSVNIGQLSLMRFGKSQPLVPVLRFCQGRKLSYFPARPSSPTRRDFHRPRASAGPIA
jgi:hypothetical protein